MLKKPIYIPNWTTEPGIEHLLGPTIPWRRDTETRQECFMTSVPYVYQYGTGRGIRTYTAVPITQTIEAVMQNLNDTLFWPLGYGEMNGCFLNRYDDHTQHLGWHADDFEGMDHERPVCVVSFGQPREIWFRENGVNGTVPKENRQILENGSLLIMPHGFQGTHQHRIPKGDRTMSPRVSLTFRAFKNMA